ncbi:MAG TPA: 16S rRNA (adenine(1518)-N(6)/adenine(1519)-N(6))-dimethyltransferase RsmA [Patescibacteria group bacterium]|nr:16S rRNA (adenine(1518)-N(6)/adenine(1519)-N(6))-dimethyltransferase RsmA [Patescibacteria group bacterium]
MNDSPHIARKRFGQNFLHERGIIDRILRAIDPQPGERIVEIGPGQGALTWPLLDRIKTLTAIEIDRDLIPRLQAEAPKHGELQIVEADVLTVDFTALAAGGTIRLVGNLPYNISSPILFHALDHAPVIRDMHFMLQKEVVERMAASHGNKVYGRLSVMLQAYCRVDPLFTVPPGAFTPAPKVDSAIVRLTPKSASEIPPHPRERLEVLVRHGFSQRRKTLRNALDGVATSAQMAAAGIDPGARAEAVAVGDWLRLAAT